MEKLRHAEMQKLRNGEMGNSKKHACYIQSVVQILNMKSEFTAIIEAAPEGGFWAICPEISGADGQGATVEDAKHNLIEAIQLILE